MTQITRFCYHVLEHRNKKAIMTQVSRRYIPPKVSAQIFDMFLSTISTLSDRSSVNEFLEDLLSPTEQTMLGKRLAIAYMLQKGYTQRDITNILKVGLATVNKISLTLKLSGNGYTKVIAHMLKIEKINAFFDKLDEKLDHLLPPRGANWSTHYKNSSIARNKKKLAF